MMTIVAAVMMIQGVSAESRSAYVSCLRDAVVSAKTAKIGVDGFKDYARKTCATVEDGFKSKLVSFNVKNGMSKKAAADDAEIQLEDYVYSVDEKYRYSVQPPQ